MSEPSEGVIVNTFAGAFQALTAGRASGTISRQQEDSLIHVLGQCFKDYVNGHRSAVEAHNALAKAKHAAKAQPSQDLP